MEDRFVIINIPCSKYTVTSNSDDYYIANRTKKWKKGEGTSKQNDVSHIECKDNLDISSFRPYAIKNYLDKDLGKRGPSKCHICRYQHQHC